MASGSGKLEGGEVPERGFESPAVREYGWYGDECVPGVDRIGPVGDGLGAWVEAIVI